MELSGRVDSQPEEGEMDEEGTVAWGEAAPAAQERRANFLLLKQDKNGQREGNLRQPEITPLSGIEWVSRKMVEEMVKRAAELAEWTKEMGTWEEWEEEEERKPERSRKHEEWLWKRLEECDKQQAKEELYKELKKSRKVAKSRVKMKVGKNQPSIKEQMARTPAKVDWSAEKAGQYAQLSTMSNGPSKGPPVTLGHSNRSPYTPLVYTKVGCGGQDEH